MPLLEGLQCLPTQSQEHGGDSRRQAFTLGAIPSAGPVSAPLYKEGQDEHCQNPTKWPPADLWCECLWQKNINRLLEGGLRARHPLVAPVLTARHRGARLAFAVEHQNWQICHWHPVLHRWQQVTLNTCDRCERVWRSRGECYAACNIVQHDGLMVGQCWSGEAYPWRDTQTSTG